MDFVDNSLTPSIFGPITPHRGDRPRHGLRFARRAIGKARGLVAASLACLFASSAHAATICVDPDKSSCEATIQAGILAADPGDKVKIASGVYFENVEIPAGKTGIRIEGKRSAILDAGDNLVDEVVDAPAILVGASDVRIEGITLRGGSSDHIRAEDNVSNLRIEDVRSLRAGGYFVAADDTGPGFRVEDCLIESSVSGAIVMESDDARVRDNVILGSGGDGVSVFGDDVVVEDNFLSSTTDGSSFAILVDGDGAEVAKNEIEGYQAGVFAIGDDAFVERNQVHNVETGIVAAGDQVRVERNRVEGSDTGILAYCEDVCDGARVYKNEVRSSSGTALQASADGAGMTVAKNEVRDISGSGYLSTGDAGTAASFSKNIAKRVSGVCFQLDEGGTARKNEATSCGEAGFVVDNDQSAPVALIDDNRVTNAGTDGFVVLGGAINVSLVDNRSKDAAFSGFALLDIAACIAPQRLVLEGNRSSGSRFDLCNDSHTSRLELSDNDFETFAPVGHNGNDECPTL